MLNFFKKNNVTKENVGINHEELNEKSLFESVYTKDLTLDKSSSANVFLFGRAGAGKTHGLSVLIRKCIEKEYKIFLYAENDPFVDVYQISYHHYKYIEHPKLSKLQVLPYYPYDKGKENQEFKDDNLFSNKFNLDNYDVIIIHDLDRYSSLQKNNLYSLIRAFPNTKFILSSTCLPEQKIIDVEQDEVFVGRHTETFSKEFNLFFGFGKNKLPSPHYDNFYKIIFSNWM